MRTTRASWGLLAGAALALATTICVVDRTGRMTVVAPTRSAFPKSDRQPVYFRRDTTPAGPVNRQRVPPELNPFFPPDIHRMILYTSPGFQTAPK